MEKKSNPHNTAQKAAMYVSSISIIVNLLLSLFKLIAGIIARSDAMISDAVHSASDVLSTIVVIVGSKISSKESDTEHPYGHERIECVSSIILSGMLLVTGIGIRRIDLLHTRLFGMKIYVDIEIAVDENLRLKEAHHIAEQVHYSVENSFPEVKHCMVHVNPASTVPVGSTK